MAEWHLSPDYIVSNWTDELLNLMTEKLIERKNRETRALRPASQGSSEGAKVSDSMLFFQARNLIKVVRK